MERRMYRARRSAGFTLAEVLVTLGIIAVLLTLAVPSVGAARKNLKMAELNAAAKEIFLAAQNNLTGMAAGGGAVELSAMPKAADAEVCLMSGDAGMDSVLPLGAVDPAVSGNHYVVVYFPGTLTVKEVYYSERALTENGEGVRAKYGDNADLRREDEVGFYNGENIASNPPKTLPKPVLTVENGEELVVTASAPELDSELIGKVTLTVSVASVSDPKQIHAFEPVVATPGAEWRRVLDSLTGEHFYKVCQEITPGDDIEITAELNYTDGDNKTWLSSKETKTTNSLFAGRAADGTVSIACGRHLQNLDINISGQYVNPVTSAVQTATIQWDTTIPFKPIFNFDLINYNGNGLEICNLTIRTGSTDADPSKRAGLFADFESTTEVPAQLENVRLVDPRVDATGMQDADTGALAGHITNAVVRNCQVFATSADSAYVKGSGSTGGLFGAAVDCRISQCSSGLPLVLGKGSTELKLGGLIGNANNTTLISCYAASDQLSGRARDIGGFIGRGDRVQISDCYAVGNISAIKIENGYISGFMNGNSVKAVKDSYCAMTYFNEDNEPRALEISYGFMSAMEHQTCAYLKPNTPVTIHNQVMEAQEVTYEELKTWRTGSPWRVLDEIDSHPYRDLDADEPKAYPFPGLQTENGSPLPHYGSWPKEPEAAADEDYLVVYYEIYRDASGNETYGFFYQDDTMELDTLQNVTSASKTAVVWDGYALLCKDELKNGTKITVIPADGGDHGNDKKAPIAAGKQTVTEGDERWLYLIPSTLFLGKQETITTTEFYAQVSIGAGKNAITFYCNPWFAKTAVLAEQKPSAPEQVIIRTPRHLRMLGQLTQKTVGSNIYPGLSYSQELDLNYRTYIDAEEARLAEGVRGQTYAKRFKQDVHRSVVLEGGPNTNTYYGGDHLVIGLTAPMFQAVGAASAVENVVVQDAKIKVGQVSAAGILAVSNAGRIQNCVVRDSSIEGEASVAGFLGKNISGALVQNCQVQGASIEVESEENGGNAFGRGAFGFAVENDSAGTAGSNTGILSCAVYPGETGERDYDAVSIDAEKSPAAGFINVNRGYISGCFTVAEVEGDRESAGFAISNAANGTIERSYANCEVEGGKASGFVGTNLGEIRSCYALKKVEADHTAAGFAASNIGNIRSSYSAAELKGSPQYGFTPLPGHSGAVENCYYLNQSGLKEDAGTKASYDALTKLVFEGDNDWSRERGTTYPFENEGQYPFPMLAGLDHWGDWPVAPPIHRESVIGLAVETDARYDSFNGAKIAHYKAYGVTMNENGTFSEFDSKTPKFEFDVRAGDCPKYLFYYDPNQTNIGNWGYTNLGSGSIQQMPSTPFENAHYQNYTFISWTGAQLGMIDFYCKDSDGEFPDDKGPTFSINVGHVGGKAKSMEG